MKTKADERYVSIEAPTRRAVIDFLSEHVSVAIELSDGKLEIIVKASPDEDSSTWGEETVVLDIDEMKSRA